MHLSSSGASGIYNERTGKAVTRMEQIEGIIKLWTPADNSSKIVVNRSKPDSFFYMLDISKTEKELGYVPNMTI